MQPLILIIDDDKALSGAMTEALRESGYRVACAENSEAGLRAAQKRPPNLILCDVMLPDAPGFDTVSALRADPLTSQVPVVLITGDPDANHYEGTGKSLTLMKPFSLAALLEVVRGTLAARRSPLDGTPSAAIAA